MLNIERSFRTLFPALLANPRDVWQKSTGRLANQRYGLTGRSGSATVRVAPLFVNAASVRSPSTTTCPVTSLSRSSRSQRRRWSANSASRRETPGYVPAHRVPHAAHWNLPAPEAVRKCALNLLVEERCIRSRPNHAKRLTPGLAARWNSSSRDTLMAASANAKFHERQNSRRYST